jgi:hypothetical protein
MTSEVRALPRDGTDPAPNPRAGEARSAVRGPDATRLIRDLAERQHGVVARRQLIAGGLSCALIDQRVNCGALLIVHRGVYAIGPRRWDLRERLMAAVLACGDGAVLSHASAARLWGIRGSRGPVEVTRASGGTPRRGIRAHQVRLQADEMTTHVAIPITTIERTLLDIAPRLDRQQMERAVVEADRSGHLQWGVLRRVIAGGRGRPGVGLIRAVAKAADPAAKEARSPPEIDLLALCRDTGLPTPVVNVLVEDHLVDFYWPAQRLVVETDSYTYHGDPLSFERDHRRTAELTLAGYEVRRVTREMLEGSPEQVIALIQGALQAQRIKLTTK